MRERGRSSKQGANDSTDKRSMFEEIGRWNTKNDLDKSKEIQICAVCLNGLLEHTVWGCVVTWFLTTEKLKER